MKLNVLRLIIAAATLTILFTNCSTPLAPPDAALSHISSEADLIIVMKPAQLMEKADFEAIKQLDSYVENLERMQKNSPALSQIFADPSKAGIDLEKNIYSAYEVSPLGKGQETVTISLNLKDKAAFEKALQELDVKIEPASNGFQQSVPHPNFTVGWNEEVVLFVGGPEGMDAPARLTSLFELLPEESITQNRNLRECIAQSYDIALWVNGSFFFDRIPNMKESAMLMQYDEETLAANFLHNFITFETDAIETQTEYFIQPQLANDLDLLFRDGHNTNLVSQLPQENLSFLLTAALELKGFNQLMIEKYSKGVVQQSLEAFGVGFDEVLEATNGDIAVAGYDITALDSSIINEPQIIFATPIQKQATVDSLIKAAIAKDLIAPAGDNTFRLLNQKYQVETDSGTVEKQRERSGYVLFKENTIFITNSESLLDQLKNHEGGTGNLVDERQKIAQQYIFSLYTTGGHVLPGKNLFEELGLETVDIQTNRKSTTGLFKLPQRNQNSLKTIFEQIDTKEKMRDNPEKKI